MAAPSSTERGPDDLATQHQPFVADAAHLPEFTWSAVLVGAVLGIVFGASSLYLVLKVGMTVSASVPIAVLSITLFRWAAGTFGIRRATILENNIVQTTGSAGESIAFGVGVTMPALLLLGFEMEVTRVMTVAVLGGLLGILMMIPLRRAFIVKQHGKLAYPEGTACAEVLIAGEKGGATARMVFIGFGLAVVHKFLAMANKLWTSEPAQQLFWEENGAKRGLKGAEISGELTPELLGVGFLIGPRIAALMLAGAFLSYFVLGPLIAVFGENLAQPVSPATKLIADMGPGDLKANYLRYIGAGAVAAGGIISMFKALPLIITSIVSGLRDLRSSRVAGPEASRRTERDLPMTVVLFGSLAMVAAMMLIPSLGLGLSIEGFLGAALILLFGFLFVTVSSRLTGEIGSSSNPISGMTIATLLMTCLIFLLAKGAAVDQVTGAVTDPTVFLTALTIAAVVCIASSNGGTTSQDLKTGYLVGATPRWQQWSILVGALTSALVIGGTMLALDAAGTHYTNKNLPEVTIKVPPDAPRQQVGRPHDETDKNTYRIVHVHRAQYANVKPGRYLVDDLGRIKYKTDLPIAQESKKMDNNQDAPARFTAPQPQLFASIIEGILGGTLEWGLFFTGVLIALTMELSGVSALPFAVGMYLPLSASTPIFIGGMIRWLADKIRGVAASEAESETSPGILLSSGFIAGGTLAGLVIAFFTFLPPQVNQGLDLSRHLGAAQVDSARMAEAKSESEADSLRSEAWLESIPAKHLALGAFGLLGLILAMVATRKAQLDDMPEAARK